MKEIGPSHGSLQGITCSKLKSYYSRMQCFPYLNLVNLSFRKKNDKKAEGGVAAHVPAM